MYSVCKKYDKELLLEIAQTIEVVAKIPTAQATACLEELGKTYLFVEERIKTKDYTQDDYYEEQVEKYFNAILCRTTQPTGTT